METTMNGMFFHGIKWDYRVLSPPPFHWEKNSSKTRKKPINFLFEISITHSSTKHHFELRELWFLFGCLGNAIMRCLFRTINEDSWPEKNKTHSMKKIGWWFVYNNGGWCNSFARVCLRAICKCGRPGVNHKGANKYLTEPGPRRDHRLEDQHPRR